MVVYFTMLFFAAGAIFVAEHVRMPKMMRQSTYMFVGMMLIFIAGFRHYVGTDYAQYVRNYSMYLSRSLSWSTQPALSVVAIVSKWIKNDYATWFFLMSLITVLPVLWTINKHSVAIGMSLIMYVLLGCWHFSFNIVKQSAAASFLFLGYGALKERKLLQWMIFCGIASMFHVTAILMVFVYFLVDSRITKKKTLLLIAIGIVILLSYDYLFEVASFLKQGESLVGINTGTRNNSVNILRILVNCAPILLTIMIWKKVDKNDPAFATLFNMSLLNMVLNVGSMNSIYLNRFCCYTNIYNVLYIPMLFKKMKGYRKWFIVPILILYVVFWAYDLYKGSDTVVFNWVFNR